jgi:hypothetical protein
VPSAMSDDGASLVPERLVLGLRIGLAPFGCSLYYGASATCRDDGEIQ